MRAILLWAALPALILCILIILGAEGPAIRGFLIGTATTLPVTLTIWIRHKVLVTKTMTHIVKLEKFLDIEKKETPKEP
jgi:amino acid permease